MSDDLSAILETTTAEPWPPACNVSSATRATARPPTRHVQPSRHESALGRILG